MIYDCNTAVQQKLPNTSPRLLSHHSVCIQLLPHVYTSQMRKGSSKNTMLAEKPPVLKNTLMKILQMNQAFSTFPGFVCRCLCSTLYWVCCSFILEFCPNTITGPFSCHSCRLPQDSNMNWMCCCFGSKTSQPISCHVNSIDLSAHPNEGDFSLLWDGIRVLSHRHTITATLALTFKRGKMWHLYHPRENRISKKKKNRT